MLNKFQCGYKLTVNWIDKHGEPVQAIVTPPITVDFSVIKSTRSENSTRINVYNMDGANREEIYKDIVLLKPEETVKWVTLEAGYAGRYSLVSWGYIQQCSTVRKGTDVVTTIDVIDPDILTEYCGITFKEGTTYKEAYEYLVSQLPSLKLGETGILQGEFKVPTVFDGNTYLLLNKITGRHTFVDNGVINTLGDNETLTDYECYYIAADTGLLETPKRYDDVLEVQMLFEPTIRLGQLVEIKSETQSRFDGQFKVLGINHNCLISGSMEGTRTTTLQLQYIYGLVNSNVNLTQDPEGAPPSVVKNNKTMPIGEKIGSEIKSIFRQIAMFNGNVPRNPITNLINWYQMIYAAKNSPTDVKNTITLGKLANCVDIATKLTQFCNQYFKGKTITVTCGYRTPQRNSQLEASSQTSAHMQGKAIDFCIDGVPIAQQRKIFIDNWGYGLGIYLQNNFIHVSTHIRQDGRYERFTIREKV